VPKPVPQEAATARLRATTVVRTTPANERTMTMMYATLTLMAGMIGIMFVASAVSSVVNAVRENEAVKVSLRRSAAF
jgi:hypothetical protein